MRISDWSSDVCSSDLWASACRFRARSWRRMAAGYGSRRMRVGARFSVSRYSGSARRNCSMANEPVVHVIDDDEAARHSLEFLVDCAGLRVRPYESAIAFLEAVPQMEHGCIVHDVRMPEMSGIELIGRLKELGTNDPVIVIPGHADETGKA